MMKARGFFWVELLPFHMGVRWCLLIGRFGFRGVRSSIDDGLIAPFNKDGYVSHVGVFILVRLVGPRRGLAHVGLVRIGLGGR